ncbi:MAG: phosphatidylglycerol lysyltransferase domain-containing protein, partial [Actinobacteria bacterium]|nr:phosphatidylglycerol lysyltransferase domain-containing protein [Actinomycetota bacterium]
VLPIHIQGEIPEILPFGPHYWNRSLSLIFGFALLYLSLNLFRRKRVAWWLAATTSAVAALVHSGYSQPWYTVVAPAVTLGLLLLFRRRFTVHSEPESIVRGLRIVAASIVVVLAYGTAGFWLLDIRDFGIDFSLADAFVRTLRVYTLIGNHHLVPRTDHATWFLLSLRLAGLIVGGFAAYSLFRPLVYRFRSLPHERQEAKTILKGHGTSSLDFFKLWPDKSYFFSENHETFIAYKQAAGVAIALGDPVGPEHELEATTQAFVRYCSENGWSVAFHEVLPSLLPMYRRLGLRMLKIGEEAIIDLEHFRSHTVGRKSFRYIRRKFEREGYVLTRHAPPHPWALLNEMEEISEEWLSLPGRRERGFTLGSFERGYLSETPLFVVRDPDGHPLAFANEVPSYREGEATIDLMRYRLEMPNGTMEYLLTELMLALWEEGYRRFDLGLAPLAGVGDRPGATLQERALSQLSERLTRFFSYKGLRNYKAKFEPDWEDRFLVYGVGPLALARVGVALTRVTEG